MNSRAWMGPKRGSLLVLACLLTVPHLCSLEAQIVPVKTVPVATGDQFLLFPSEKVAMGNVSLALADTLGDFFSNPATGIRVRESFFFGSPTLYQISDKNGSGRTLPVGTLLRSGESFGGVAFSLQEVEGARRLSWVANPWLWGPPPPNLLSEESARNLYAFGILGRRFPELGLSVGLSASWADLAAVDGVDLLYAFSRGIEQSGHLSDVRLGVLKEWPGDRSLELLLLRSRLRMRHEVTYADFVEVPIPPDTIPKWQWRDRIEKNFDHTDTWGAHLAYRRPLQSGGWTVGWSLTGNWKDHSKIPNYEIQNIPRDPGTTRAFSLGVGLARTEGPTRLAVDVLLEPIFSETWADAGADTISVNGDTIFSGERTMENDFRFTNAVVRTGGSWSHRWLTLKAGLEVRSISYELDQFNLVEARKRDQKESWMQWVPSLGARVELGNLELHYALLFTTGTGRPGTRWDEVRLAAMDAASDFIAAPSGPLTLQDATVTTHQLSIVVPLG